MRIGIITFHFPYNCGAALQCMALQNVLKAMGHEVCVIDYRPWYHQNRCTPVQNPIEKGKTKVNAATRNLSAARKAWLFGKGVLSSVYALKDYRALKRCDDIFQGFIRRNLNLTPLYRTYGKLRSGVPACDLYICGSDQVWNYHFMGDAFDPAYFMIFGPENARRITYAASVQLSTARDTDRLLPELLKGIDAISLREYNWYDTIRKYAPETPICQSLDPTLLLTARDYEPLMPAEPLETDPFVLLFTVDSPQTQRTTNLAASLLHERTGLKVIDCTRKPRAPHKVFERRLGGPAEFLWYIRHARYIVTNSFHGTVFSLLMGKSFASIIGSSGSARITSLLDSVGLSAHYTNVETLAAEIAVQPIDYAPVYDRLSALREASLNYLRCNTGDTDLLAALRADPGSVRTDIAGMADGWPKGEPVDTRVNGVPILYRLKGDCCGCSACQAICPKGAITMREDIEGFLYPVIDEDKCVRCAACQRVCALKEAKRHYDYSFMEDGDN